MSQRDSSYDELVEIVTDLCNTVRRTPDPVEWHFSIARLLRWQTENGLVPVDKEDCHEDR